MVWILWVIVMVEGIDNKVTDYKSVPTPPSFMICSIQESIILIASASILSVIIELEVQTINHHRLQPGRLYIKIWPSIDHS